MPFMRNFHLWKILVWLLLQYFRKVLCNLCKASLDQSQAKLCFPGASQLLLCIWSCLGLLNVVTLSNQAAIHPGSLESSPGAELPQEFLCKPHCVLLRAVLSSERLQSRKQCGACLQGACFLQRPPRRKMDNCFMSLWVRISFHSHLL